MELKVIKTKKQYEDTHYPIPMPDPIDAIRVKMNELGLKNKEKSL